MRMKYYAEKLDRKFFELLKKWQWLYNADSVERSLGIASGVFDPTAEDSEDPEEVIGRVRGFLDEIKGSEETEENVLRFKDFLADIVRCDKSTLTEALELYYENVHAYYEEREYRSHEFQPDYEYFTILDPFLLHLCGKHYHAAGDEEKFKRSCLYSLISYAEKEDSDIIPEEFERNFSLILEYGYGDWLCIYPRLSYLIGKYFLYRKQYRKACRYFRFGTEMEAAYNGRQIFFPLFCIGMNQYMMGNVFHKGLGYKINNREALNWYSRAASNFNRWAVPVMGDIYFEGNGVRKDPAEALNCYTETNPDYPYDPEILYLNPEQEERCRSLLEEWYHPDSASINEKLFALRVYRDVLWDPEKAKEISRGLKEEIAKIPYSEWTCEMEEFFGDEEL